MIGTPHIRYKTMSLNVGRCTIIAAKAAIQKADPLDARLRGHDGAMVQCP